jgi:hypothetical protein
VGFNIIDQLLNIIFFIVSDNGEKLVYNEAVRQIFIDFRKTYDSARMEVLYNIILSRDGVTIDRVWIGNWIY